MKICPDYRRGVYNIPYTLLNMLGFKNDSCLEDFKDIATHKLFFVLIDGLGYNLFKMHGGDFLNHDYIKITSTFPSTTAAALTTIYTGLSPREHGILEWYMYYEEYDGIIKTLPFTPPNSMENDYLLKIGISPESLFPFSNLFDKISDEKLESNVFLRKEYAFTSYTTHIFRKAKVHPYGTIKEGFELMKRSSAEMNSIYIDSVDSAQHHYGPNSREVEIEIKRILHYIKDLKNDIKDSVIVISADHGQIEINKKAIFKFRNSLIGGSPRDMFVYSDEKIPEDMDILNKKDILPMLGPGKSHPKLWKRLPNYIVLPKEYEGVWFEDFSMRGLHGGLTSMEMFVPFLIIQN